MPSFPAPVDVKLRSARRVLGCLWAGCIPFGLIFGAAAIRSDNPVMLLPIVVAAAGPLILISSRRLMIARADDRGLTLRSGRVHRWEDLARIARVEVTRRGRPLRVDFVAEFSSGKVRLRSNLYEDVGPIYRYLETLWEKRKKK